jgi:hypothetical protein
MATRATKFETLDDLRGFVNKVLCDRDQLEVGAFMMTERLLVRGGKPCGMHFCLHGPRSLKLSAIWDALSNAVLFYGSSGERFFKAQLDDELARELLAA